jgi:hypothetical protein
MVQPLLAESLVEGMSHHVALEPAGFEQAQQEGFELHGVAVPPRWSGTVRRCVSSRSF